MVCGPSPRHIGAPDEPLCLVWIVSSEQLLAWTQNPTRVADLNNFAPLKCSTPQVDAKICNGMPQNEAGLLSHCPFPDFPFYTCVSDHPECNRFLLTVTSSMDALRSSPLPPTPTLNSLFLLASNHVSAVGFSYASDCPAAHFSPSTCQLLHAVLGSD